MKKIALLLAMLICVVPVLTACGANSSPDGAVEAALVARYEDFDYEALYELSYKYDKELFVDLLGSGDVLDAEKNSIDNNRETLKETVKAAQKLSEMFDDYSFDYEIRYCNIYDKKDDAFDTIIKSSKFSNEGYGDVKDAISKVAKVRVIGEIVFENDDGNCIYNNIADTYTCYYIDGDWYVNWSDADVDSDSVEMDGLGDLDDLGNLVDWLS